MSSFSRCFTVNVSDSGGKDLPGFEYAPNANTKGLQQSPELQTYFRKHTRSGPYACQWPKRPPAVKERVAVPQSCSAARARSADLHTQLSRTTAQLRAPRCIIHRAAWVRKPRGQAGLGCAGCLDRCLGTRPAMLCSHVVLRIQTTRCTSPTVCSRTSSRI